MEGADAAEGGGGIQGLPEGCISLVLSFTTPKDACRSAAVSWTFRSAAESDSVWERFLPPDYGEIISRAVTPVEYSSKRELYFRLCDSILIDGGRKSFALERSSGKKCFMLSARELVIVWEDNPSYWQWVSHPESRFSEVAELLDVCWLEIRGKVDCRVLSENTDYVAYLVFKLAEDSHGLGFPQETSLRVGDHTSRGVVCLKPGQRRDPRWSIPVPRVGVERRVGFPQPPPPVPHARLPVPMPGMRPPPLLPPFEEGEREEEEREEGAREVPWARDDGWMEIKIGEFFNDKGDDGEVDMCLMEVKAGHWKHGLIVEGIEVRPRR